jgi:hypothetical protein
MNIPQAFKYSPAELALMNNPQLVSRASMHPGITEQGESAHQGAQLASQAISNQQARAIPQGNQSEARLQDASRNINVAENTQRLQADQLLFNYKAGLQEAAVQRNPDALPGLRGAGELAAQKVSPEQMLNALGFA